MLYYFHLGFTAALILIVYIGAIAILFLFIIMMIPIREQPHLEEQSLRVIGAVCTTMFVYLGGGLLMLRTASEWVTAHASDA
jgi:NADH:ubiquinone oxidoreductase subunit 6 (subunit J)